jgi:hypothetical protein
MNYKIAVTVLAIPIGMTSLMTKSVSAEVAPNLDMNQVQIVVTQRYDDRQNSFRREELQREATRRKELRQNQIRREEAQRNQIRRDSSRRVRIAGHYEPGFLGIGRKCVEGHWEDRR